MPRGLGRIMRKYWRAIVLLAAVPPAALAAYLVHLDIRISRELAGKPWRKATHIQTSNGQPVAEVYGTEWNTTLGLRRVVHCDD